jgi:hypothetical protein
MNSAMESLVEFCTINSYPCYGILPWKLLNVGVNYIKKEVGYIDKWQEKIDEFVDVVRRALAAETESEKMNIFYQYVGFPDEKFGDDM